MNKVLTLLSTALFLSIVSYAQKSEKDLWHHKDLKADGIPGISLKQAYDYLGNKPSKKVIVAIIDGGYDINHQALKGQLWVNEDEIAGNGLDDDNNGYIDDIHGWNFLGGSDENIINETLELTREYRKLSAKYENSAPKKGSKEDKYWQTIKEDYLQESEEAISAAEGFLGRYESLPYYYKMLSAYTREEVLSASILSQVNSEDSVIQEADNFLTRIATYLGGTATLDEMMAIMAPGFDYYDYEANYAYNLEFDPRSKVGDDINNPRQKGYGNNQVDEVSGFGGSHGSHVSGIVGGKSDDQIGVTSNIELMVIRTVPSGDERDKDVANSIIYAVDNGAKVINMSFGKEYSPNQDVVRSAVKYAEKKGVLMVHAAGNESNNTDEIKAYPDGSTSNKKVSPNWIEVGASSRGYDENLTAVFTNYGKNSVDLFAPGVEILSSVPEDEYEANSGTSMAAPVVSGVAAMLMSYFPNLSAAEIKKVLVDSSSKIDLKVLKPGTDELVDFSELSKSGGIVNALEAVKMAESRIKISRR